MTSAAHPPVHQDDEAATREDRARPVGTDGTVLPILITGEPVLHRPARPVTRFGPELGRLARRMLATMDLAPGVGLAGPQVGVDARLFVYGWTDKSGVEHRGVAVNPTLWIAPLPIGPVDADADAEGCLSVPGYRYPVRRSRRAVLEASDVDNQPFRIEAEGWLARIFQHEYDHLDGVLYVDRLEGDDARSAARKVRHEHWGRPGLSWLPGSDDVEA